MPLPSCRGSNISAVFFAITAASSGKKKWKGWKRMRMWMRRCKAPAGGPAPVSAPPRPRDWGRAARLSPGWRAAPRSWSSPAPCCGSCRRRGTARARSWCGRSAASSSCTARAAPRGSGGRAAPRAAAAASPRPPPGPPRTRRRSPAGSA